MRFPLITAHAGCMNTKPNTIKSILKGIKSGADIVEVDVRVTKDGYVVLIHDSFIKSRSSGICQVDELNYDELIKIPEAKDIVKLEQVFQLDLNNTVLNLDVKVFDVIDPLVKMVKENNMIDNVVFSGCTREKALYIRNKYSGIRLLLNVDKYFTNKYTQDYKTSIVECCRDANEMSCCGINIEYKLCTKELIQHAHSRFLPVAIWTVDDANIMKQYIALGVDSITTNLVNALVEFRGRMTYA